MNDMNGIQGPALSGLAKNILNDLFGHARVVFKLKRLNVIALVELPNQPNKTGQSPNGWVRLAASVTAQDMEGLRGVKGLALNTYA